MKRNKSFDGFNRTHTYQDGTIRIVTNDSLTVGTDVPVFVDKNNHVRFEQVSKIIEQRPSEGNFSGYIIPTSYRVATKKTRTKEQDGYHQKELRKIVQLA